MKPAGYNASGKASSVVNCGPKPDKTRLCNEKHCLFNLHNDPCEYIDVSSQYPEVFQQMKNKLEDYKKGMVPPANKPGDENCNPDFFGGVWTPWIEL